MSPIYVPGKLTLKYETVSPLLLDSYSGAAAAYSLRQLSWAYGGPVVRVRRDNDNAEQDFTATEVSDGTLAAWVGAGNNGFVRTWYDQSGNGQDAIQTTAVSQPKVVDSSTGLILENGKPGVAFDGSDDFLQAGGVNVSQPCSIALVAKKTNTSHYFDSQNRITLYGETDDIRLSTGNFPPLTTNVTSALRILFFVVADLVDTVHVNSIQKISGDAGSNSLTSLILGRQASSVNYARQTMQDFIVYPNNQSANRAAIEANINAHYSIYP